jgi:hypothetical protein
MNGKMDAMVDITPADRHAVGGMGMKVTFKVGRRACVTACVTALPLVRAGSPLQYAPRVRRAR